MTCRHTEESLRRRIVRTSADWSCVGIRLIDYLAGRFTYRDAEAWKEVIAAGEIMVNHRRAAPEQILEMHDLIEYLPDELPEPEAGTAFEVRARATVDGINAIFGGPAVFYGEYSDTVTVTVP